MLSQYKNPLFIFALESEAGSSFPSENKVFIGIGKLNAAYHLTKAILQHKPDIIINLGTAGSSAFQKGEIVCCNQFIQRDMNVEPLGFQKFETPLSGEPPLLQYGLVAPNLPLGICGTGDSFETQHLNTEYNVIDMEAYALALIAKRENIPFLCLKYISDGADDSAATDWTEEVKKAAIQLKQEIDKLKIIE